MPTETSKSVRELVMENPAAARVFERLGIDYCCGGNKSLEDACRAARVAVEDVTSALGENLLAPVDRDWQKTPLAELVQHIIDTHHAYTREEIKRLGPLIIKVISSHGANHPELLRVQSAFRELASELTTHMMKEEQILFPYLVEMEAAVRSKRPLPPAMFGTVQNPVRMMMMEHDSAGEELRELKKVTSGYAAPADGCITYETLYRALAAFEADLHQHIHLENNILFPRAVQLEEGAF
jgi:regulator of cell morphogenesis and NO signaling